MEEPLYLVFYGYFYFGLNWFRTIYLWLVWCGWIITCTRTMTIVANWKCRLLRYFPAQIQDFERCWKGEAIIVDYTARRMCQVVNVDFHLEKRKYWIVRLCWLRIKDETRKFITRIKVGINSGLRIWNIRHRVCASISIYSHWPKDLQQDNFGKDRSSTRHT